MAKLHTFLIVLVLLSHAQIIGAFSDGNFQRICMAANWRTGHMQPALEQNVGDVMGFHAYTRSLPDGGWLIQWNIPKMLSASPSMRQFIFYHECAHARFATSDEAVADCEGIRQMHADIGITPSRIRQIATFYAQFGRPFPPMGCP